MCICWINAKYPNQLCRTINKIWAEIVYKSATIIIVQDIIPWFVLKYKVALLNIWCVKLYIQKVWCN